MKRLHPINEKLEYHRPKERVMIYLIEIATVIEKTYKISFMYFFMIFCNFSVAVNYHCSWSVIVGRFCWLSPSTNERPNEN